jgi:NAD(P)-dependent dehydrogenase (short-subunit alcohol dehydrogenase family)
MPTDNSLAGKTTLITGASAGIGAGLARRLGALGADVRVAARRKEKLDELVESIRSAGGSARAYACDLASSSSVAALFEAVARDGGDLDAVVNTAAVLWLEPFATQPEENWRAILATNLAGAICVTQHALVRMLPQERGHIVHVTSIAGDLAIPYLAIYSTAKAGLAHFLDALRGEYGKSGVRFTELQIGNTAGTEGGGAAFRETTMDAFNQIMRWTGAPAMLEVDDVVEAAVYALSTPSRVRLDRIVLRELAEMPT